MIRTILTVTALLGAVAFAPPAATAQASEIVCEDDNNRVRIHYSLYYENYRAQNYEAALTDLDWILECAPGFGGQTEDDRNFRRAVEIYEGLAEAADDEATERQHLDRALETIDAAVPTLQDAGVEVDPHAWLLRKGRFIQNHPETLADMQHQIGELYEEAFHMRPDETDDYYLQVIAFSRAEAALADDTPEAKREARDFLLETLTTQAEDPGTRDYIDDQADRLITTPREAFAWIHERYQEHGVENLTNDEIEQLFTLNQQAGTDLIGAEASMQLRRELLPVVAEMNPTFSRMSSVASAALADGEHQQAIDFFERALELAETNEQRSDTYYNMGNVRYQQNQMANAANYLREALAANSSHGQSLYLMGTLIQSSITSDDVRARAAYWCAADWFSRAASQGVSNAGSAASSALRGAPSAEEYFFLGWRPGQQVNASYGWGSCQATVQ